MDDLSRAVVPFSLCNNFHNALTSNERLVDVDGTLVRIKQGYKQDGRGGTILGFGASLYDCSLVMLHYLLLDTSIVNHKVVLELGCGTGFLSIALGIIGASVVLATDGDRASLDIVRENISTNDGQCGDLSIVVPMMLRWGCGADQLQVRSYLQTAVKEHSKASPDLIVACDVAAVPYADAYAALVQTLVDNCSDHSTVVLLGYQRRHLSEEAFFSLLALHFSVCRIPHSVIHRDFASSNIEIYSCRLLQKDIDRAVAST